MKNDREKRELNQAVRRANRSRKPYEAPKLIVHGSVEELTKASGLLLTDTLLTGSTVTTVTVLG